MDWERITDKLAQERRVQQLMVTLEHSTSNTFLCDLDWNVLYANEKAKEIMAFMEPNLHRHSDAWKSFRAADAVGKSLEWLFTDEPEHFKKAADPRNHPYHGVIKTGPCVCDVSVTSTKDEQGRGDRLRRLLGAHHRQSGAGSARQAAHARAWKTQASNTLLCDLRLERPVRQQEELRDL